MKVRVVVIPPYTRISGDSHGDASNNDGSSCTLEWNGLGEVWEKPDNSGGGVLADAGAKSIGGKPAKVIVHKRVTESRETIPTTRMSEIYAFQLAENKLWNTKFQHVRWITVR